MIKEYFNRKIEFKFWNIDEEFMYGPYGIDTNVFIKFISIEKYSVNCIPLQSIHERDCNNNKIFEGDVLLTDEAEWIGVVVFQFGRFYLEDKVGGFSLEPNWNKCKIIGNVFKNYNLISG